MAGEPGPVFIEIPVELQLFQGKVDKMPLYNTSERPLHFISDDIPQAIKMLKEAKNPGIYVGWGAVDAVPYTMRIAERLNAPVCTTLQGKSSFPSSHSLHTGFGFGPNAVPASQKAFKNIDLMLAVGVRFSEIGTGSYGATVPENLIHVDINPQVFNKNYPAAIAIQGDATKVLREISEKLEESTAHVEPNVRLQDLIRKEVWSYLHERN